MDMSPKDEAHKMLSKHVENCQVCAQELKKFQMKSSAAQVYIPKATMDHDLRQSFEREVGELFKILQLNEREALKHTVKKKFRTLDQMGIDFIATMTSKSMIKIYVIAAAMFVALKYFF